MTIYQGESLKTDRIPGDPDDLTIPLLGLVGEAGSLLSEYKKKLRDRESHELFMDQFAEEIGDILWYLANLSSRLNLDLSKIARSNLNKVNDRWASKATDPDQGYLWGQPLFDSAFEESEQLPRYLEVEFRKKREAQPEIEIFVNGKQVGNKLNDNAYAEDGYRYHDVFHLAYAAILGWSPVFRDLLGKERKSVLRIKQVEDGARAKITEEAISQFVFTHAENHRFFENITDIDWNVLRTIKTLTKNFEVNRCSAKQWQTAILKGFEIYRKIKIAEEGIVILDLNKREIHFQGQKK